jgi:myo-inositol-1(or 4)-monophosphatase
VRETAEYEEAAGVAHKAARAAAEVHRAHLGRVGASDWSSKGTADFVSYVDREAEAEALSIIRAAFPSHAILAEESADAAQGAAPATSDWVWIVDPLDGTTNFLHQYPMYCSSVALLHEGIPTAASVVCSATEEEWTASLGSGVFRNGERTRVSEVSDLRRALVGTGFPFKIREVMPTYLRQFAHIIDQVSDLRRGGAAALDLCYVASGFLDGFWELDLRPWDYAAGVLMIREAGGVISGLDGEPVWEPQGGGIIAGNPHVYPHLVRSLEEVKA